MKKSNDFLCALGSVIALLGIAAFLIAGLILSQNNTTLGILTMVFGTFGSWLVGNLVYVIGSKG